ncbi:MAG: ribonuclease P protein component [Candidatus Blackburnbacteria bacterium]|nr:ribonuclease P protein component [Candidatus Blackburnbacteria bacterium]
MLPKKYRLTDKADFDVVFSKGWRISGRFFVVLVLEKSELFNSLLGIIVSSKVSKKAVDRNRIKRVVRSALGQSIVESKTFYLVVVIAKAAAVTAPSKLLEEEAITLLGKIVRF